MQITVEQIAEEALALPSEARALLADRLVESLDPAEDGYIRQLWVKEAQRRIAEVRSGNAIPISGEAVFAQVSAAIKKGGMNSILRLCLSFRVLRFSTRRSKLVWAPVLSPLCNLPLTTLPHHRKHGE